MLKPTVKNSSLLLVAGLSMVFFFQNCSKISVTGVEEIDQSSLGEANAGGGSGIETDLGAGASGGTGANTGPGTELIPIQQGGNPVQPCQGVSCDLTPLTTKPGVTTILLTLGDQANSGLVIHGASSQMIAETAIRSTSPVANPKILVVLDQENAGEDLEDISYLTDVLLSRYTINVIHAPATGLSLDQVNGFDLIWYNNPGHPMSSRQTMTTLLRFQGGVILQGDDLSIGRENGRDFDLSALTGLRHIDNGAQVVCAGRSYAHDNNSNHRYRVSIDSSKISGDNMASLTFEYGNDIDDTKITSNRIEVVAKAVGGPESCNQDRPAIVRYLK